MRQKGKTNIRHKHTIQILSVLHHVSETNFGNLWKEAYKRRMSKYDQDNERQSSTRLMSLEHDEAVLELLTRLYGEAPVIFHGCQDPRKIRQPVAVDGGGGGGHVALALAIVCSEDEITVLRPSRSFSLRHALTFSPYFLGDSTSKHLFVTYQILHAMREVHSLGLSVGDITTSDISVDHKYFVTLKPDIKSNMADIDVEGDVRERKCEVEQSLQPLLETVESFKRSLVESSDPEATFDNFLGKMVSMWKQGLISNFDYLIYLNMLAGRSFSNPNYYPVLPWVRDFSSECGGWRDLSKSKYRLNKGDAQLDLTFDSLSLSEGGNILQRQDSEIHQVEVLPPHHVTEVLSEITYYVYRSRTTSKTVLCQTVRQRWVPNEYPVSMQRLQSWTPDECIPDFYMDPSIFKSIHDDLPDLEVPPWCGSPEEFVSWHRASLESKHVSEKLNQWIDLTFGYKLSGGSAIRAKNVCLVTVDNHSDLRRHGVVQLFSHPHPVKSSVRSSQYWLKTAPRVELLGNRDDQSDDSDVDECFEFEKETTTTSEKKKVEQQKELLLPKDFDPLAKINELEGLNSFLVKSGTVFHQVPADTFVTTPEVQSVKELSSRKHVRDMQVLGCLLLELFLPKRFSSAGPRVTLEARFEIARNIVLNESHNIPLSVRHTLKNLVLEEFSIGPSDRYPAVNDEGLPPLSAFQLLLPTLSSIEFPRVFPVFGRILRNLDDSQMLPYGHVLDDDQRRAVDEFKVKSVASELQPIYDEINQENLNVILPAIKKLFEDDSTAVIAAWYLFEPVGRILGPEATVKNLLSPILNIYESHTQTSKHLKLYHRTFLQFLIVRFGTRVFLRYFSTYLIEAVGGYKDYEDDISRPVREGLEKLWQSTEGDLDTGESPVLDEPPRSKSPPDESLAEGEVFDFDSVSLEENFEDDAKGTISDIKKTQHEKDFIYVPSFGTSAEEEETQDENQGRKSKTGNISQVAAESVLWLV